MNELDDICRFPLPALNDSPEDIRDRITQVNEKSEYNPNVFMVLARRPVEFRAFFDYHYCVIAHGAILRIRAKDPFIADQIAVNYRKADITPRQRATCWPMALSNSIQ